MINDFNQINNSLVSNKYMFTFSEYLVRIFNSL